MLPRAAARSIRAGGSFQRLTRPAYPITSIRSYAKGSKPKKSTGSNIPPHSANFARPNHPAAPRPPQEQSTSEPTTGSSDKSGKPDYSTLQDEFEVSSASSANTAPQDTSPSAVEPAIAKANEEEPKVPFYDLTKGIPSTLEAEMDAVTKRGQAETQEQEVTASSSGGRGERSMPASAYETSADRRRNKLMLYTAFAMGATVLLGTVYFGRNWESEDEAEEHPDAPSGWSIGSFYNRIQARAGSTLDHYTEPAFAKLLPDPDPAIERPFTLVISLEDLLMHSEWTREHGWRIAKRPGMDYFIRYLTQYYELVIFTSLPSTSGGPLVQKLDPYRLVPWNLFREATKYKNGEYIKDLSFLNRDLSRVIMIDTEKSHAQLQPENAIIIPKWKGEPGDKGLVALIPFLEYVAAMTLDDTRKVLASYEGKDIPTEFAIREQKAREKFNKQLAEDRTKGSRKSGIGFLGSALGIKPGAGMETVDGMPTLSEGLAQGKMLHDQVRERGQKSYELMEKEIRENGESFLKQLAEDEKKYQEEAMKGMTSGFKGWFGGSSSENK